MAGYKTLHIPTLSSRDFGLFRSPGPGLGNLMFPISRALVGAETSGGIFVYPTIRQLKIGTYLRNEPDKRTYGGVFKSRNFIDWKIWSRAQFCRSVNEDEVSADNRETLAIRYSGLKSYFHDIHGHENVVSNWINDHAIANTTSDYNYDIAVHIRLGDFTPYVKGSGATSMQLPFSWYKDAVELAIGQLGRKAKVLVFTDSTPDLIEPLAKIWNADIDESPNAISAILKMSKAKVIITSRSTFSMWGAYLGQAKCIWDKDFDVQEYYPTQKQRDIFL